MKVKAFLCQHKTENYDDCEDRFCINPNTKSIAVADGMSQSFLPEYWADIICRRYCESNDGWVPTHETVQVLETSWQKLRDNHLKIEESKKNPFTYLISNAIAEGASAACTFAGIRLISSNHLSYHILGDSSLVIFHDGKLLSENDIVSTHKGHFDSYPDFFDSNHKRGGKGEPIDGSVNLTDKDTALLVSDPFSDFFYEKVTSGNDCSSYFKELIALSNHDEYLDLVDRWRTQGMHDDDSTVVILQIDNSDKFAIDYQDADPTSKSFVGNTSKLVYLNAILKPQLPAIVECAKLNVLHEDKKINKSQLQDWIDSVLNKHKEEKHRLVKWLFIFLWAIPKSLLRNKEKKAIKSIKIIIED